jgi:HK97 family phage portal protein
MGWSFRKAFGLPEQRMITSLTGQSIERPNSNLLSVLGIGDVALPAVTIESALTVPAVWAAVSFLSRTLAALPLHAYRNTDGKGARIEGGLETLIHEAPNPEWTSFKLRQHFWQQVFTGGRGLLYIERSGSNIIGLYPIDPTKATITRSPLGQTTYTVGSKVYQASEIVDVPFMLRADGLCHYGPISQGAAVIQLALSMNSYGANVFARGGVLPLAVVGPPGSGPEVTKRMVNDIAQLIQVAKDEGKQLFPLPTGYDIKQIGFDPEKGQMVEGQRFAVEQIARLYNMPPVFLQDLTNGTFSNTEQQDLFFVKHLVGQWAQALEEEMNLKLFGQRNGGRYVEHNLDGLLRGDFKTRADAVAALVNAAVYKPNEGRKYMGQEEDSNPAADKLYIQGATVPLEKSGEAKPGSAPPAAGGNQNDGA